MGRYVLKIQITSNVQTAIWAFRRKTLAYLWAAVLPKFQCYIEKLTSDFFLGSGLSWTLPFRDIKILWTHVAIDTLTTIARKDNAEKYIVLLYVLRFNVSSIKKTEKNEDLMSLWWKLQSKKKWSWEWTHYFRAEVIKALDFC